MNCSRICTFSKFLWVVAWGPPQILSSLFLRALMKEFPTIPANIIHTCHMGFHVDFSSSEIVMGCGPKLLSCKAKVGTHDPLKQLEVKDSKEP